MSAHRMKARRAAQKKHRKTTSLNLVSLMDIFTILVFFLMVNSSDVEVLETSSKIKLPDSVAEKRPDERIVISVSDTDVIVQGRAVAQVAELKAGDTLVIPRLHEELMYQASKKREMPEAGFEITIMGDKEIPYWLLKRIMMTCQVADFAQISLAVNQVQSLTGEGPGEAS